MLLILLALNIHTFVQMFTYLS